MARGIRSSLGEVHGDLHARVRGSTRRGATSSASPSSSSRAPRAQLGATNSRAPLARLDGRQHPQRDVSRLRVGSDASPSPLDQDPDAHGEGLAALRGDPPPADADFWSTASRTRTAPSPAADRRVQRRPTYRLHKSGVPHAQTPPACSDEPPLPLPPPTPPPPLTSFSPLGSRCSTSHSGWRGGGALDDALSRVVLKTSRRLDDSAVAVGARFEHARRRGGAEAESRSSAPWRGGHVADVALELDVRLALAP